MVYSYKQINNPIFPIQTKTAYSRCATGFCVYDLIHFFFHLFVVFCRTRIHTFFSLCWPLIFSSIFHFTCFCCIRIFCCYSCLMGIVILFEWQVCFMYISMHHINICPHFSSLFFASLCRHCAL